MAQVKDFEKVASGQDREFLEYFNVAQGQEHPGFFPVWFNKHPDRLCVGVTSFRDITVKWHWKAHPKAGLGSHGSWTAAQL